MNSHFIFTDIFNNATTFLNEYKANPTYVNTNKISDANAMTLYYLLYSKYGNSSIANDDVTQFKFKLWTTIFQFGPTWEKQLDVQYILRNMSEADLMKGAKVIYNHAYNDGSSPSTSSLEETEYINEQNTTNNKKNKLTAYAELMELLATDVTQYFLDKFKPLFKRIIVNTCNIYCSEGDE